MNVHDSREDGHTLMHDACDLADNMVNKLSILRSTPDQLYARGAYLAFFIRMVRVFRAFSALMDKGLGPEAALLIRPFYDTLVDWLYIESDPVTLGERYMMHLQASHLQWLRDYGTDADTQRYVARYGDIAKEFRNRYCSGKDRVPREWVGLQMEEKAARVGLSNYYLIFRDLSNKLHNSPWAAGQYIDTSQADMLAPKVGPDFSGLENDIALMCLGFVICLQKGDKYFDLQSGSLLDELGRRVTVYAESCNRAGKSVDESERG